MSSTNAEDEELIALAVIAPDLFLLLSHSMVTLIHGAFQARDGQKSFSGKNPALNTSDPEPHGIEFPLKANTEQIYPSKNSAKMVES